MAGRRGADLAFNACNLFRSRRRDPNCCFSCLKSASGRDGRLAVSCDDAVGRRLMYAGTRDALCGAGRRPLEGQAAQVVAGGQRRRSQVIRIRAPQTLGHGPGGG